MIRFHKTYFIIASIIFVVEVLIALFIKDRFIRPYFGDVLVVMLIYCFIQSFLDSPNIKTAIGVLLFAFFIEWLQYINFIEIIGVSDSKLANIVFGNSFAWLDMLAYTIGVLIIIVVETYMERKMII